MDCSKKLDKIDKIFISLNFIIVTFVCILNTFCFAETDVNYEYVEGLAANWNSLILQDNQPGRNGLFFEVQPGHIYNIEMKNVGVDKIHYSFTFDRPANGVQLLKPFSTVDVNVITFTVPDDVNYVYFYGYNNGFTISNESSVIIKDITRSGISSVIDNLYLNVGLSQIWSVFENCISYILVVVLFSLGFWFIKHNIIEHSKGRDF